MVEFGDLTYNALELCKYIYRVSHFFSVIFFLTGIFFSGQKNFFWRLCITEGFFFFFFVENYFWQYFPHQYCFSWPEMLFLYNFFFTDKYFSIRGYHFWQFFYIHRKCVFPIDSICNSKKIVKNEQSVINNCCHTMVMLVSLESIGRCAYTLTSKMIVVVLIAHHNDTLEQINNHSSQRDNNANQPSLEPSEQVVVLHKSKIDQKPVISIYYMMYPQKSKLNGSML